MKERVAEAIRSFYVNGEDVKVIAVPGVHVMLDEPITSTYGVLVVVKVGSDGMATKLNAMFATGDSFNCNPISEIDFKQFFEEFYPFGLRTDDMFSTLLVERLLLECEPLLELAKKFWFI